MAHHVIDFLFEQATAGAVGRPEMDVFIAVRRHAGLSRDAFDAWVDSLSRAQAQRRVATPAALERLVEGMARPIADILLGALFDGEPDGAWQSQAIDAAEFVVLARGLLTARAAWVEGDQCLIPLADLSSFGLRDMDLGAWLRGADVEGQLDERCARLMEHAKARALAPLASAVQLIDTLPGAPARALAAYLGLWAEALLSEPIGRRESPQPLNVRLKSHRFRAWRFAISCRFDPRLLAALAEAGSSRLSTATRPAT